MNKNQKISSKVLQSAVLLFGVLMTNQAMATVRTYEVKVPIIFESPVDGLMKRNIEFYDYCGMQNAKIRIDVSKYVRAGTAIAAYPPYLKATRDQFGPAYSCSAGMKDERNYLMLNQIANEVSKSSDGTLPGILKIEENNSAPLGYNIKLSVKSTRFEQPFVFVDNIK